MEKELVSTFLSGRNMLITGGAGVGKSFYTRLLTKLPEDTRIIYVTATTGVAAENVNGCTVHSYIGSQGYTDPKDAAKVTHLKTFKDAMRRIQGTSVLFIDEISMDRADHFELVNILLSRARANAEPFGGIQIVLCGDFLQLAPVYNDNDNLPYGKYVFETNAFKEGNFAVFNLTKVYRQADENFIRILNNVRFGSISNDDLALLQTQRKLDNPIYLLGTNREADRINELHLAQIEEDAFALKSYFTYNEDYTTAKERALLWMRLKKEFQVPEELEIKIGSRVVLTKNNADNNYVNGSTGTLIEYGRYIKSSPKYERVVEYLEDELGRERREYYKLSNEEIEYFKLHWDRRFRIKKGEFTTQELCIVALFNGQIAYVERADAEIKQSPLDTYDTNMVILAKASYFPIKFGWAITTHKSQGMTLDEVSIDAKGFFAEGQFYVALSRCKTLEGVTIKNLDRSKILTCEIAKDFYKGLQ